MSFDNSDLAYRYGYGGQREHDFPDDWVVDSHAYYSPAAQSHHLSALPMMPIRRFINEPEYVLFHTPTQSDPASLPPFQTLDIATSAHPTLSPWPYNSAPQLPSPSHSGPSSLCFSSCASDRQSTPLSPPDTGLLNWSDELSHASHFSLAFGGGHDLLDAQKHQVDYPCVAMTDIQSLQDVQPEKVIYDEDTVYYGSHASATYEGYQPVEPDEDIADSGVETEVNDARDSDYTPRSLNLRRRRPQPTRSTTSPRMTTRVTKRSSHTRRSSAPQSRTSASAPSSQSVAAPNRTFACALAPYGCDSTFGSKNEWKRHVNTQHMRLGYWRCDQCDSNKKPNDFNRKDLFIQHVRRMHPVDSTPALKRPSKQTGKPVKGSDEEQTLNAMALRCLQRDRPAPSQCGCHFCDVTFEIDGDGSTTLWDKRLEHVAQHMETRKKAADGAVDPSRWRVDARLERWLVSNGIVVEAAGGRYKLA